MVKYMEYSSYIDGDKKADVIRDTVKDNWGVKFSHRNEQVGIEWYKGHSEIYAENAAENWVMGIKEVPIVK
tara:strand:- start:3058 stop:3270 length:213 start_codon:yes stop_codon:yes gene_type:complete